MKLRIGQKVLKVPNKKIKDKEYLTREGIVIGIYKYSILVEYKNKIKDSISISDFIDNSEFTIKVWSEGTWRTVQLDPGALNLEKLGWTS